MILLLLACADGERPFGGLLERSFDADGDGWASDVDCDDEDPQVNPGAEELPYSGVDEDCDAATPDDDLDGDGYLLAEDCDDQDAAVHPGADDPEDGVDQDCDGVDSCGLLFFHDVPMTLYDEDMGFFCASELNSTSARLTLVSDRNTLPELLCVCEVAHLQLLAPAWSASHELGALRPGLLEINGNSGLTWLDVRAGRVELLGLTSLQDLRVEADSLRLESHSPSLKELSLPAMQSVEVAGNPGLASLRMQASGDLEVLDATAVSLQGEQAGMLSLAFVTELSAPGLRGVQALTLQSTALSDLDGLGALEWVEGDLVLRDNALLSQQAIEAWLEGVDIGGTVVIEGNGQ